MYYKREKISIEHGSIFPNLAVLDYTLLKTLPDYQKKSTLLDSLCQAIEAFWAKGATTESKNYSRKCISLILNNYKNYIENNTLGFKEILQASNYSGKAINIAKTTSAHAMSYKLTSTYNISHGHAVALCIIPIWKLLAEKAEKNVQLKNVLVEIANIFGTNDINYSIKIFESIFNQFNLPKIHIKEQNLPVLVNSVNIERMNNNPIKFTLNEVEHLYGNIKTIGQY